MIRWRLGLDAGRRWRGSGTGMKDETRGNGAAGDDTPGAGTAITEVLDTYDRKADVEALERAALDEERSRFRERAEMLLDDIIGPTLEAIGQEVIARGHHWTIEERIDIQSQPAISCLFRTRPTDARGGPASELTFRCLFPDRVSTTAVIHRGGAPMEMPARSHLSSGVNAEMIRDEVARFMKLVLDAK
ncbi:MAG: hypothetical protein MJB57_08680 [Gemmatimonadetes bacterium]|nr:hypothetical protein [Gemmatimonadota bacterium]